MSVEENKEQCKYLNRVGHLDQSAYSILINNIAAACNHTKTKKIQGMTTNEWRDAMNRRVGNEPMARLLFVAYRDMLSANIPLGAVLSADPALFMEALKNENMNVYYGVYPN